MTPGSEVWDSPAPFADSGWSLDFPKQGYSVHCMREYGDGESMRVSCFDEADRFVWGLYTNTCIGGERDATNAFAGGTAERPQVMAYNAFLGLVAIDLATGQPQWTVNAADADLGGSQISAVVEDGTVYVGGYYGPDPVAISAEGSILWKSDVDNRTFWLHELSVEGDAVVAKYTYLDEGGYSKVWFDRATGEMLRGEMRSE